MSRRGALAAAAVVLAAAVPAVSGPSSRVAWTLATVDLVRSGDAVSGRKLNAACVDCHGPTGRNPEMEEVADLAGQDPFYTYKQLQDYKVKLRASDFMNDAAASLSDRDMADLAAFFAAQKPAPASPAPPAPEVLRLTTAGDGARLIPACDACHGERGAGDPGFYGMPRLLGQKRADLSAQLVAFRSGKRGNDVYSPMREVASHLSDAEIAGLAGYYAGQTVGGAPASSTSK
jgi:cytochrome c553